MWSKNSGFTLIELMVVIALIGILAAVMLASLNDARTGAKIVRAKADLQQINRGIISLGNDSLVYPGGYGLGSCVPPSSPYPSNSQEWANGVYVSDPRAGLVSVNNPLKYVGWNGPYIINITDPWGQEYMVESHYQCRTGDDAVLNGQCGVGDWVYAIVSGGPNLSGFNMYDNDNVIFVVCAH